jgi:hypothetical protein
MLHASTKEKEDRREEVDCQEEGAGAPQEVDRQEEDRRQGETATARPPALSVDEQYRNKTQD